MMGILEPKRSKISTNDCLPVIQALVQLLGSGVSIANALNIATELIISQKIKTSLNKQCEQIINGNAWSSILKTDAYHWPNELIAWIEIGESTGELAKCLKQYCDSANKQLHFRKSLLEAMAYPLIVLFVSLCAALFIHITFADLGNEETIKKTIHFNFEDYAICIGIVLVSVASALKMGVFSKNKYQSNRFTMPLWSIQTCHRLADTFQSLAFMLACGIPILEAVINLRERFIHTWNGSPWIGKQLACLHSDIESGYPLRRTMELLQWPSFAVSLATIAEQTGDLPSFFEQLARIYYQQADIRKTYILRWAGPLTLCISAGLLIGSYCYSIWPMYAGMNDMVQ